MTKFESTDALIAILNVLRYDQLSMFALTLTTDEEGRVSCYRACLALLDLTGCLDSGIRD